MYSILDIETTGNHAGQHHITEIAILNYDGENITEQFSTLVRPESEIPFFISRLTGITHDMVLHAPDFESIADVIASFTANRILIAHNAHFDYTFLKHAFQRTGRLFQRRTLCTLRLSRKIIPGLRSYALGNLCRDLQLPAEPAHRAESDAYAALEVFRYLQGRDHDGVISSYLKRKTSEFNFPPHLSKETVQQLPAVPGVYYFKDRSGKILYIGKAKNLKQRVLSHFSGTSSTRASTALMNQISGIDYTLCGNELIAMLLESSEIKKYFPPFNAAQKITSGNYGIYCYEDGKGYYRLGIRKVKSEDQPLASFPGIEVARSVISEKKRAYGLCARLCGLQHALHACHDHLSGICDGACCGKISPSIYNARVKEALNEIRADNRSFILVGSGRSAIECGVIVVEGGRYLGFGFLEQAGKEIDFAVAKKAITHYKDNREVQGIIRSYLVKHNDMQLIEPAPFS